MNVLKRVAKAHGVTEKEVRDEMQKAIRAGRVICSLYRGQ